MISGRYAYILIMRRSWANSSQTPEKLDASSLALARAASTRGRVLLWPMGLDASMGAVILTP